MSAGASQVGLKLSVNYPTTGNYLVCNSPVPALAAGASVNLTVGCLVPSTVPAIKSFDSGDTPAFIAKIS